MPRYRDGEQFIQRLEDAQEQGNLAFINGNLPRLRRAIAQYQDRIYELTTLQQRAREILERHEQPADERGKA